MNVEEKVIQLLGANGRHVYADVPNPMPDEFVTVERTGGSTADMVDRATLAVQCWAIGRKAAADMADEVRGELYAIQGTGGIGGITVESLYNWPDLESRRSRYQMTVGVTAHM